MDRLVFMSTGSPGGFADSKAVTELGGIDICVASSLKRRCHTTTCLCLMSMSYVHVLCLCLMAMS